MRRPNAHAARAVLALIFLVAAASAPAAEPRSALVIGNGAYADSPLRNPVNDARDVAAALRECGFSVIERTDADKRAIEAAVEEFTSALPADGVATFYYSGHGVQSSGVNYLVPVDARVNSEADIRHRCVSASWVLDRIHERRSRISIVMLDACRNNPFGRSYQRSGERGLAVVPVAASGSVIVYATAPNSVAADGSGRNGLFTGKLLKYLPQPGLELSTLLKRVGGEVQAASSAGRPQIPWVSSSLTGDFYFVPPREGGFAPPAPGANLAPGPSGIPTTAVPGRIGSAPVDLTRWGWTIGLYVLAFAIFVVAALVLRSRSASDRTGKATQASTPVSPQPGDVNAAVATSAPVAPRVGSSPEPVHRPPTVAQRSRGRRHATPPEPDGLDTLAAEARRQEEELARQEAERKAAEEQRQREEAELLHAARKAWTKVQEIESSRGATIEQKRLAFRTFLERYALTTGWNLDRARERLDFWLRQRDEPAACPTPTPTPTPAPSGPVPGRSYSEDERLDFWLRQRDEPAACPTPTPTPPPVPSGPVPGRPYSEDLGGGVKLEMVWVPGGEFLMGSPPSHRVRVDGFWMGKYEVTNAQYRRYQSGHSSGGYKGHDLNGDSHPVVQVSWTDATGFCAWLTRQTGKTYRLPTEAEWEYACRAGSRTLFCFGGHRMGAYPDSGNEVGRTYPVGGERPNEFGLYDMDGNVYEWCGDWYDGDAYSKTRSGSLVTNPTGPGNGTYRVLRGGSWHNFAGFWRSALRWLLDVDDWTGLGLSHHSRGFRVVAPQP